MKAPDKVFFPNDINLLTRLSLVIKQKDDVCYIRKDALLEWLRKEADKSYNSFAREELGLEARHRGLDFEEVIRKIKSL